MLRSLSSLVLVYLSTYCSIFAQIGIGTSNPDASAILELVSTSAGVLIPRMTEAQRDAISSPATGLQVYQTDNEEGLYFYDGSKWRTIASNDRTINTITATTTLDDGHDIVFVNNSSVIDIDLPTAVGQEGRAYYIKKISNNTTRARIDPNGSQTIDGADTLELFVENDAVRIISDGSNWRLISDELKPHTAKITRDAAQSIATITWTKIAFDNEDFDIGGIADIASSDRIDIRRAGRYLVTMKGSMDDVTASQGYMGISITINGTSVNEELEFNDGGLGDLDANMTEILDLAVDDYIELYIYHNHGSNRNTKTGIDKPHLSITEIRY